MSDKIGLFTGSFDPVTNGHMDIIRRASRLFTTFYVGIFYNKDKQGLFSIEKRKSMLEEAVSDLPNVKVIVAKRSLVVDIARQLGVTHLVRGFRGTSDIEHEMRLEFYNKELAPDIETLYFSAPLSLTFVSSSHVRELIHFKADISQYVPASVVKEVGKIGDDYQQI